jgi:predicted RNase H-like HicB family nuclease
MKLNMSETKKVHLPVLIEQDEDGVYIVSCPQFKACHSYGKTVNEALSNLKEVVEMCLEEEGVENLNQFIGFREFEMELS